MPVLKMRRSAYASESVQSVPTIRVSPIRVIADDFTGGNDTGLQFHAAGLRTLVCIAPETAPRELAGTFDVLVLDTESRNCDEAEAYRRVAAACQDLTGRGLVYKKVDSTLRGNLRTELDAVMQSLGFDRCLMAPAFPDAGRTTVGGYHLVHGVPLERTEAARDPAHPVRASFVPDLLRGPSDDIAVVGLRYVTQGPETLAREIARLCARILVLDAASSDDLRIIAATAAGMRPPPLLCGSAGLAAHVPSEFGIERPATRARAAIPSDDHPVLAIVGSLSEVVRTQVRVAREEMGAHLLELRGDDLARDDDRHLSDMTRRASELARTGEDVMVVLCMRSIPTHFDTGRRSGQTRITRALGHIARTVLESVALSGLILTGGTTAASVVHALGGWGTRIVGEVQSGVPACILMGGDHDGMRVVTKGGALGDERAIVQAIRYLKGADIGD